MKKTLSSNVVSAIHRLALGFRGLRLMLRKDPHTWVHVVATVAVVIAGFYFGLSIFQWGLVVVAVMAVWTAEAANSAIETLGDAISEEHHPLVGMAKDLAAGAVLASVIGSVVIGLLVFGPHLLELLGL